MGAFGQKCLYSGKVVLIGKIGFSSESGCTRGKVVFIRAKMM